MGKEDESKITAKKRAGRRSIVDKKEGEESQTQPARCISDGSIGVGSTFFFS